jgi:undecaprenyl diphosphate synthase
MIIRTGCELRLSNFMLWQAAYSEFYFTDTLWPDFGEKDVDAAIEEYSRRQRRFGSA